MRASRTPFQAFVTRKITIMRTDSLKRSTSGPAGWPSWSKTIRSATPRKTASAARAAFFGLFTPAGQMQPRAGAWAGSALASIASSSSRRLIRVPRRGRSRGLILSQGKEAGPRIPRCAMGRAQRGQEILGAHHVAVVRFPVGVDSLPAATPEHLGTLGTLAGPGLPGAPPARGGFEPPPGPLAAAPG